MRFFLAALALGAVAVPLGCSSLLGDFPSNDLKGNGGEGGSASDDGGGGADSPGGGSDGSNGSTDSSSDTTMRGADGDAPTQSTDGSSEAAPSLKLLNCTSFEMQNPLVVLTVPGLEAGTGGGGGN